MRLQHFLVRKCLVLSCCLDIRVIQGYECLLLLRRIKDIFGIRFLAKAHQYTTNRFHRTLFRFQEHEVAFIRFIAAVSGATLLVGSSAHPTAIFPSAS